MKITYLLGAGASKNAVPVVNGLSEGMIKAAEEISKILIPNPYIPPPPPIEQMTISLCDNLKMFGEKAQEYGSIDTYAKALFLMKSHEPLKYLKATVMAFLSYCQNRNGIDSRYFGFLASMLDKKTLSLSPDIRVLSWNYDNQFENAYAQMTNGGNLNIIAAKNVNHDRSEMKPSIFKMNGGNFCVTNRSEMKEFCDTGGNKNEYAERLVRKFAYLAQDPTCNRQPGISFAWEENDFIAEAIQYVADTEILVVIGYSFPFFNRYMDGLVLGSMPHLSKIYFQSPDAEKYKNRIMAAKRSSASIDIVTEINDMNQFLLPDEL